MTEIPEHLLKRARASAAAAATGRRPAGGGGAAGGGGGDAGDPAGGGDAGRPRQAPTDRGRRSPAGGAQRGTAPAAAAHAAAAAAAATAPARPASPGPRATPSACSPSSRPGRSRTSRPPRPTRSTPGRTCSSVEFVAALAMTAFLLVFSAFVNAPLLGMANFNLTPNPSKAPWYFLGLQELLTMFHPMVAGVTIPGWASSSSARPATSTRTRANKPEDRKFAIAHDDDVPHVLGRRSSSSARSSAARASTSSSRGARASTRSSTCRGGAGHEQQPSSSASHRRRLVVAGRRCSSVTRPRPAATAARPSARCRETGASDRSRRSARRVDARTSSSPAARSSAPAVLERRGGGTELVAAPRRPRPPPVRRSTPRRSASPAASSSTGASPPSSASASPASAARCIAFLWPTLSAAASAPRSAPASSTTSSPRSPTRRSPSTSPRAASTSCPYPEGRRSRKAKAVYTGGVLEGMEQGVVALYQKCVHLGCRVPWCKSSQWFECPCHGSKYNRVGEKKAAPRPAASTASRVAVEGGVVVVDTGALVQGPPIGTNTTGQEAGGPALRMTVLARRQRRRRAPAGSRRRRHRRWRRLVCFVVTFRIATPTSPPVGAEIELAPNRKPYSRRRGLERAAPRAGASAGPSSCWSSPPSGLPLYWLDEPSRQAGADRRASRTAAVERGPLAVPARRLARARRPLRLRRLPRPRRQGGVAAVHAHRLPSAADRARCSGRRPPLNTVAAAVPTPKRSRTILIYGRANTPMPAWGVDGGGPMNDQQVTDLVAYIEASSSRPTSPKARREHDQAKLGTRRRRDAVRRQLRPLPHQGLVLRRARRGRAAAPSAQPHRRRHAAAVPRRRRP